MLKMNLKISKLDAAKRQIETAVFLYFNEGDPISIHTLTMAASNVLRDLNGGKVWMIKTHFNDHIKEGMEKEAWKIMNRYENFLKHADTDPDGILDFNPDVTEICLWEAGRVYREFTGESPHPMVAYNIWFKKYHDQLFIYTPEEIEKNQDADRVFEVTSRREYFSLMIEALNRQNT